ncbi:Oidioi.mRNA.OKI2018_I69.chr2.g7678.t1.cds [Oikopleura dioica]|uniref:Oidioi.mRNA.OKI2018_I69.chr2.g7678.t1.cds n=1 Tax=Oikopleura dioica TaxID=34765 RepID=A0ABN7T6Y7_OIKDI|nr:Oidioi.mRNA.OKI2018_I69.chr2.g7678.t1.cds [Oikopleura dioica]
MNSLLNKLVFFAVAFYSLVEGFELFVLTDGPRDKITHHRRWKAAKTWLTHVIDATKIGTEIHFITSSDPNHKVNIRHASGTRDIHSRISYLGRPGYDTYSAIVSLAHQLEDDKENRFNLNDLKALILLTDGDIGVDIEANCFVSPNFEIFDKSSNCGKIYLDALNYATKPGQLSSIDLVFVVNWATDELIDQSLIKAMTKIFPDSRIVCGTLDSLRETAVELLRELNTDITDEPKLFAPEIRMLDQLVDH